MNVYKYTKQVPIFFGIVPSDFINNYRSSDEKQAYTYFLNFIKYFMEKIYHVHLDINALQFCKYNLS